MPVATADEARLWDAVLRRDTAGTGEFFYAVKTTGVYCRPTCASRRPLRKNVEFFTTTAQARAQGYRACKRCRPDDATNSRAATAPINAVVHELARQIEANPEQSFRLTQLAKRAGYSPFHLQRNFKAIIGSTLGLLMIGATDRGICFLQFGDSDRALQAELRRQFPAAAVQPMPATHEEQFESWMAALNRHLRGLEPRLDLPLDVRGTAFQLIVWRYLQKVPYGEVRSYSEVAEAIGKPSAARAVARACASNGVALLIPCHRVVRGTGELGGYRWGVQRKRVLLDTERASSKRAGG